MKREMKEGKTEGGSMKEDPGRKERRNEKEGKKEEAREGKDRGVADWFRSV